MDVRGIRPTEPQPLTLGEKILSDVTLHELRRTELEMGRDDAIEIAIGQIDGCSRYLHGDEVEQVAEAAE